VLAVKPYLFIALGVCTLYQAWRGIVPDSFHLWGKRDVGQPMGRGQRLLFAIGGLILLTLGVLGLVLK